jgi:hypothetical protein
MSDKFPRGHVIFCEDIRSEIGSKLSFMGSYMDNMLVTQPFPVTIQKLSLFITYIEKLDAKREKVAIKIFLPGDPEDKPTGVSEIPMDEILANTPKTTVSGKEGKKIVVRFALVLSPLVIKEAGEIVVSAHHDDDSFELGKLDVSNAAGMFSFVPNPVGADVQIPPVT